MQEAIVESWMVLVIFKPECSCWFVHVHVVCGVFVEFIVVSKGIAMPLFFSSTNILTNRSFYVSNFLYGYTFRITRIYSKE